MKMLNVCKRETGGGVATHVERVLLVWMLVDRRSMTRQRSVGRLFTRAVADCSCDEGSVDMDGRWDKALST